MSLLSPASAASPLLAGMVPDRVLVFSSRPGRIVLDLPVPLARPREEGVRYTPEFGELARTLKRAIM